MSDVIKLYLAGTIYSDPVDSGWKEVFLQHIKGKGQFEVYDPQPKYGNGFEVVPRDKKVIEGCDFLIAYIQDPSFGTSMEIKHAFDTQTVTTFVINPNKKWGKSLWLAYHSHRVFDNIIDCADEMLKTIQKMRIVQI